MGCAFAGCGEAGLESRTSASAFDCRTVRQRRFTSSFRLARPARKPRDPTIREKFNNYRFSNHKERVIDLLRRVCTVSVATMELVDGMGHPQGEDLLVYSDRAVD